MAPNPRTVKKVKWLGVMTVLFTLSVWIVTKKNSEVVSGAVPVISEIPFQSSQERIDREKKIEGAIEMFDQNLEKVKSGLRRSPILSTKRKELRKLQRDLYAERRIIRQEIRELRRAPETQWEHMADHLESELERAERLVKKQVGG